MTCDEVLELLSPYLDGELDPEESAAVEAHLASCEECRAEFELLKETVELCRSLEEVPVPGDFRATLMKRVTSQRREEVGLMSKMRSLFASGPRRALATAAVALVLIVGVNSAISSTGGGSKSGGTFLGFGASAPSARPAASQTDTSAVRSSAPAPSAMKTNEAAAPAAIAKTTSAIVPPTPSSSYDMAQVIERQIVRRASLTVEAPKDRFDEVNRQVPSIIETLGGLVQDSSTFTEGDTKRNASYNIRVPSDKFTVALQQLEAIGKVTTRSMGTQDVTDQYIDLNAQIVNSEIQEKRLQELYSKAKTVDELIRIQTELNKLRTTIDSLKGRLRYLQNTISMSTINLQLREYRAPVTPVEPNVFRDAWKAFVESARGIVIFIGEIVPVLAVGWFVWFLFVTYKKK